MPATRKPRVPLGSTHPLAGVAGVAYRHPKEFLDRHEVARLAELGRRITPDAPPTGELVVSELARRLLRILYLCGGDALCTACHQPIVWLEHTNGKLTPYSLAGVSHFADCPNAEQFRKDHAAEKANG